MNRILHEHHHDLDLDGRVIELIREETPSLGCQRSHECEQQQSLRLDQDARTLIISFVWQILEWAFGKRITPAERLRKNQRMLDKAIRELDQVRVKLEKQEKTLVSQIKQSAQKGQMGAAKIQAKDLVRTRRCGPRRMALDMDSSGSCSIDMLRSSTACEASCRRYLYGYRYVLHNGLVADRA